MKTTPSPLIQISLKENEIILNLTREERFDRFTRITQQTFNTPIAIITLLDNENLWFKSCQGIDVTGIPSERSFCYEAMQSNEILCLPDTLKDERFCHNMLVVNAPYIRFYAGAPITLANQKIGTLCILDTQPRTMTDRELMALYDLAQCVQTEFERIQQVQIIQQFHHQKKYLSTVLDTVVDGIITIDEQGSIQTANKAALSMFSYAMEEMQGNNVNMLMPEPFHSAHDSYLHNYLTSHEAKVIGIGREVTGLRRTGETFPMNLAVGAMELDNKRHFVGIVRDITEQKKNQLDLEQFKYTLDHTVDCVFMCRADNFRFVYVNEGAKQQVGYTEAELFTMTALDIKPEFTHQSYSELVASLLDGSKASLTFETVHSHKDGHTVPVEVTLQVVRQVGQEPRLIAIVRDITERKAVDSMKSQFVSTVSHELRTPLTSIRGALGLVLGGVLGEIPEKARTMLTMANRNSERLTLLINDLLDLEKIESERMAFSFKPVDLIQVLYHALEANQGYADNYQVSLKLTESLTEAWINADENRLLQVFANLLSNAIKFSHAGGVVDLSIVPQADYYEIRVRDYGDGISEAFRSRIFGRFAQADSADNRQKGGSGLGLSISKAIVEQHKGKIGFYSQEGVGTTFFFTLPASVIEPIRKRNTTQNTCLLLCKDTESTVKMLVTLLNQEGLACEVAGSAVEAKKLLAEKKYALMIIDLTLSNQNSLDLIHELRDLPNSKEIPIIVSCSSAEDGGVDMQTNAISVADWIQKPITRERLQQALQLAIRGTRRAKVLHVEDDLDVIQIVQTILKDAGVDYRFATTLADARIFLAAHAFDLVILDLTLPDGSGISLLNSLKDRCQVMVFSGDDVHDSLSERVAAALTKSMTNNDQLLSTIRRVLNNAVKLTD